jgi:hypothetical protein
MVENPFDSLACKVALLKDYERKAIIHERKPISLTSHGLSA